MASQHQDSWDVLASFEDPISLPCPRTQPGSQLPTLSWLVPTIDGIWTLYFASYNPWENLFNDPKKLIFQYLRAEDVGIYIRGMTPTMQIAQLLGRSVLLGVRNLGESSSGYLITEIEPTDPTHPAELDELKSADFGLVVHEGAWQHVYQLPPDLVPDVPSPHALGFSGVYDVSSYVCNNELLLVGSTWESQIFFSTNALSHKPDDAPVIIAEHGIHPALVKASQNRFLLFYVSADSQLRVGKEGGEIKVAPTTGKLCQLERNAAGVWSQRRQLLARDDILHCAGCTDREGHVYVVFDTFPERPASIDWGQDALVTGDPSAQIYMMNSSDNGANWTEPLMLAGQTQPYFNPEVLVYGNEVIVGTMRREPDSWQLVSRVFLTEDLRT